MGTGTGTGSSAPNVGSSGVSLNSLVSRVGTLGQALLGAPGSSGGERGAAAAAAAQVSAAPQTVLWVQLRAIHWCPVSITAAAHPVKYCCFTADGTFCLQCLLWLPVLQTIVLSQVLMAPPDDLSPWPEGPAAAVAAPAAVRPAGDLPLASATKRILAADCRYLWMCVHACSIIHARSCAGNTMQYIPWH